MDKLDLCDCFSAEIGPAPNDVPRLGGVFKVECFNEDGTLAWEEEIHNLVPNSALNDILSVYLAAGTQKTAWFLGLIDNSAFSAIASTDTIASHPGWTENQAYAESVRQTWTPGAVSGQSVTNPTAATFTMNATANIKGAFLVSDSTKGGTTGQLWAAGAFSTVQALTNTQTCKVTYTAGSAGS